MSTALERLEDQISIYQYQQGNHKALENLISRWQARIYYFVMTFVQDEAVIWDILQEIWLGVIKSLKQNKKIENFSAWLYGVARNKTLMYLRRNKHTPQEYKSDTESTIPLEHPITFQMEREEETELLQECLLKLSLPHREVLTLFYLQDLSLKEIANVTGISGGTLRSRLHYARLEMKKLLLQKGYDHE